MPFFTALKTLSFFFETGNHTVPREKELEPSEVQTGFRAPASQETPTSWEETSAPLLSRTMPGDRGLTAAKADGFTSRGSRFGPSQGETELFTARLSSSESTEACRLQEGGKPGQDLRSAPAEVAS